MGILEELQSLQKRFDDIPTMVMSPKAYGSLVKIEPQHLEPSLFGTPVVRSGQQLTMPVVRSLDRFAEYEAADMSWAEPLGLAEWYDVDIDAIAMKSMRLMEFQLLDITNGNWPFHGTE